MNKELAAARSKRYRDAHKQEWIARSTAWNQSNKQSLKSSRDKYRKANAGKVNASQMTRAARKLHATVAWANKQAIEQIYEQARELTVNTGVQHEVDHILPLRGKRVCGFHIETNLQILTEVENQRKNNKVAEE
jgi:5-methylcytosine-specific restriction endonuclease McrA